MEKIRIEEQDRRTRNRRSEDAERDGGALVCLIFGLLIGAALGALWTWAAIEVIA